MGDRPEEALQAFSDVGLDAAGAIILIPQEVAGQHLLVGNAVSTSEGILLADGPSQLVCEEPCVEVPSEAASGPPPISQCLFEGIAEAEPAQKKRSPRQPRIVTRAVKMRWLDELLEHKQIGCPVPGCLARFPSITTVERHYLYCPGVEDSGLEQCPYCEAQFLTHSNALQEHIPEEHPTMKALLHSEPPRKKAPGTYRRRKSGADTDAPAAKRGGLQPPPLPPPSSREWEARRRTYSRAWDQPMGPTSELFRRPAEEEDPLQLPRGCLDRQDITMSSEELALDDRQLVEEAEDHPSPPDPSLLVLDTAALPRVPPRSTVYGGRGRGQRSSRRPHPPRLTVPAKARTLQVIVRSDNASGALLRDPRLLDALGGIATRGMTAPADEVSEEGSSQERVAVHAAAVEGGRYLQTELVERGAVGLRRHEVDRFFGVVKVDSACQTDDLPYRPFPRVSPAILKRATPRVPTCVPSSPTPAPLTMPKSIAVSIVCASRGYSSDEGDEEDEGGRSERAGATLTVADSEPQPCRPEDAVDICLCPVEEFDVRPASLPGADAEPSIDTGPTPEAEPLTETSVGRNLTADTESDATFAQDVPQTSATRASVSLGEHEAEAPAEHILKSVPPGGSNTFAEPSREGGLEELVEESTMAVFVEPVTDVTLTCHKTAETVVERDFMTSSEPVSDPGSQAAEESVVVPVASPASECLTKDITRTSLVYVLEKVMENVEEKAALPTVVAGCIAESPSDTSAGPDANLIGEADRHVDVQIQGEPVAVHREELLMESDPETGVDPTTVAVMPAVPEDVVMLPLEENTRCCVPEVDAHWNSIAVETSTVDGTERITGNQASFTEDLILTEEPRETSSDVIGVERCAESSPERTVAGSNGSEQNQVELTNDSHEVLQQKTPMQPIPARETNAPANVQEVAFSTAVVWETKGTLAERSASYVPSAETVEGEPSYLPVATGNCAIPSEEMEEIASEGHAATRGPTGEESPITSVTGEDSALVIVENEEDPVHSVASFGHEVPPSPPHLNPRPISLDHVSLEGATEPQSDAVDPLMCLESAEALPREVPGNVTSFTAVSMEEKVDTTMQCSWATIPSPGDDEDTRSSSEALHIVENTPDDTRVYADPQENGAPVSGGGSLKAGTDAEAVGSPASLEGRAEEKNGGLGEAEPNGAPEEAVHFLGDSGGRTVAASTRRRSVAPSSMDASHATMTKPARGSKARRVACWSRKRRRSAKGSLLSSRGRRPLATTPMRQEGNPVGKESLGPPNALLPKKGVLPGEEATVGCNMGNGRVANKQSTSTPSRARRKPRFQLNLDFPDGVPLTCSACKQTFAEKADVAEHILHEHYNLARVNDERELSDAEQRSALLLASKVVSRFACKAPGCCASFACHSSYYTHLSRCPVLCAKKEDHTPTSRPGTPSVDSEDGGPRKKRRSALRAMETFSALEDRDPSDGAWTPSPEPLSEPPSDLSSSDVSSDSSSGDETRERLEKRTENAVCLLRSWQGRFRGPGPGETIEGVPEELLQQVAKQKSSVIRCPKEGCQKEFQTVLGLKYHYPRCGREDGYACLRCGLKDMKRPAVLLRHLRSCYPDRPDGDPEKGKQMGATVRTGVLRKNLEARKWTLDYRKRHHVDGSFNEWRPFREEWLPLDRREAKRYLPAFAESPALRFSHGKEKWMTLRLFEALHGGLGSHHTTLFAGGSVWASAWCPTEGEDAEQWAALACCPDPDAEQPLDGPSSSPRGLLQLWSFGHLRPDTPKCEPRLALLVGHDWGPVADLAWCPSGCWEPAGPGRRLGLLAVACGDGRVRIFSIPHEMPGKDAATVFRVRPRMTLASPPGTALCTRLAWDPARRHAMIAVGYGHGLVAVFDLETSSVLLHGTAPDGSQELQPRLVLRAHLAAVTGLAWHHCTRSPFLATASVDRSAKLWNLQDPTVPVTVFRRSLLRSLATCQHWNGLFLAGDDTYANTPTVTLYKENGYFNFLPKSLTAHNCASWWTSVSDWLNTVAACDVGGRVAAIALPHIGRSLDTNRKHGWGRLTVYRADAVPLDGRREFLGDVACHADAVGCLGLCFVDASLSTWKRSSVTEENASETLPSQYPLNSVNTVCWNPNPSSPTWLLSGGQAGIVRVSWVGLLATSGKRAA